MLYKSFENYDDLSEHPLGGKRILSAALRLWQSWSRKLPMQPYPDAITAKLDVAPYFNPGDACQSPQTSTQHPLVHPSRAYNAEAEIPGSEKSF